MKFYTDHRMVRATLRFSKINRCRYFNKNIIHNISEDIKYEYKTKLKSQIEKFYQDLQISDIQTYYNEIDKFVTSSVPKNTLKKLRKTKNNDLKRIIEYYELRKLIKKKFKEDIKKFHEQKIEEIISQHGSVKKLRKEVSFKKSRF